MVQRTWQSDGMALHFGHGGMVRVPMQQGMRMVREYVGARQCRVIRRPM